MPWDGTRLVARHLAERRSAPDRRRRGGVGVGAALAGRRIADVHQRPQRLVEPVSLDSREIRRRCRWSSSRRRSACRSGRSAARATRSLADGRIVFARVRRGVDGLAVRLADGTVRDLDLDVSSVQMIRAFGDARRSWRSPGRPRPRTPVLRIDLGDGADGLDGRGAAAAAGPGGARRRTRLRLGARAGRVSLRGGTERARVLLCARRTPSTRARRTSCRPCSS